MHMRSINMKGESSGTNMCVEGEDRKDLVDALLVTQKHNMAGSSIHGENIKAETLKASRNEPSLIMTNQT